MDHDQLTKDRSKTRAIDAAKDFFEKSIPEKDRELFWSVCSGSFKEMFDAVKSLRRDLDSPHNFPAQEYCLRAETYLSKFKDLTRKAGIEMLGRKHPTKK